MFKIRTALVLSTAALVAGCAERSDMEADLILSGGMIWYGQGAPVVDGATAIAIADGKVLAVGSDAEIEEFAVPSTERIDLVGRRVVPGLMDSHTHFVTGGFELAGVQLRGAATPEEFARRIGEFA
ncbi:MAG: amidohydrolase, partial [Gemmatimonadota bacterium]